MRLDDTAEGGVTRWGGKVHRRSNGVGGETIRTDHGSEVGEERSRRSEIQNRYGRLQVKGGRRLWSRVEGGERQGESRAKGVPDRGWEGKSVGK